MYTENQQLSAQIPEAKSANTPRSGPDTFKYTNIKKSVLQCIKAKNNFDENILPSIIKINENYVNKQDQMQ